MKVNTKTVFFLGLIVSASGAVNPALALGAGIIYGLSFAYPYLADSRSLPKFLLQASVVALGFGMNLQQVVAAGRKGFVYTALSITFALGMGLAIGKAMRVKRTPSFLIAAGTAICGGSAIAAVGPIMQADDEEMAVAMGTVFILNAIALLIFPAIGWRLHLTQQQFGLWAAVVNTYVPGISGLTHTLSNLGKLGLTATLFLIGTGISRGSDFVGEGMV
jgi:uncharacterized membrane protein YadS